MKPHFIKQAFTLCQLAFFALCANAQYTETFESQSPVANYFNSNGQLFTLTHSFLIFSSRGGYGYQHSNRFIDNAANVAINQVNSIKTTNAYPFTIKNLWIYLSSDGGSNPTVDGSLIIQGKLGGVVQFIISKTSGFTASFVPDNGFININFATESGMNNSSKSIDEIEFRLQGNFNYIAIDNFTWVPQAVLPLSLLSYTASLQADNKVRLSWQTAYENNTASFIIEKSIDGRNFQQAGSVVASGNSSATLNYGFTDNTPSAGTNYYRLVEVDKDGNVKQLGVRTINMFGRFYKATIYPNPVTGSSFTLRSDLPVNRSNTYMLTDMSGRTVKSGIVTSTQQQVNISQLATGNYIIKLSNGEVVKWIKE
ncbi:MAG: T9SS type A sorting domain-containing protein [Ginsengibacter sp.]